MQIAELLNAMQLITVRTATGMIGPDPLEAMNAGVQTVLSSQQGPVHRTSRRCFTQIGEV
jgi:hypothetical protein